MVLPQSLTSIESSAFIRCALESITIPDSVRSIGRDAFWECRKLTRIVLPEGLEKIASSSFYQCTNLSSVVIPSTVTSIDTSAFYGCKLANVTIPANVTILYNSAFAYCSSLKRITFEGELPVIRSDSFKGVTAAVYYPGRLASYTADTMTGYGGTLSWKPVGGFEVRYDANGGSGAPDMQTKLYGQEIALSTDTPVRDGCFFVGWAETAETRTALYQPGDPYAENRDLSLYALWRPYVFTPDQILILPAELREIEEDAFCGAQAEAVLIPDSVAVIGDRAFGDIVIVASPGSAAEEYAEENGLWFVDAAECIIVR